MVESLRLRVSFWMGVRVLKRGVLGVAGRGLLVLGVGVGLVGLEVILAVAMVLGVMGDIGSAVIGLSGVGVVRVPVIEFLLCVDAGVLLVERVSI
jgi:hypothetical protein